MSGHGTLSLTESQRVSPRPSCLRSLTLPIFGGKPLDRYRAAVGPNSQNVSPERSSNFSCRFPQRQLLIAMSWESIAERFDLDVNDPAEELVYTLRGSNIDMSRVKQLLSSFKARDLLRPNEDHDSSLLDFAVFHYHADVLLAMNEILAAEGLLTSEEVLGEWGAVNSALNKGQRHEFVLDVAERLPFDEFVRCATDSTNFPWLWQAAARGELQFVKALLEKLPEDAWAAPDSRGWTPLHIAARNKKVEMVKLLLERMPGAAQTADKAGKLPIDFAEDDTVKGLLSMAKAAVPDAK